MYTGSKHSRDAEPVLTLAKKILFVVSLRPDSPEDMMTVWSIAKYLVQSKLTTTQNNLDRPMTGREESETGQALAKSRSAAITPKS